MSENVTLKIDNREVSVPKGTTVLEAARGMGIDIPTLCYMNLEDLCVKNAPASCRLCVVEVSCLRFVMAWVRMTALIGYRKKKHTWGHIERQKIQIK